MHEGDKEDGDGGFSFWYLKRQIKAEAPSNIPPVTPHTKLVTTKTCRTRSFSPPLPPRRPRPHHHESWEDDEFMALGSAMSSVSDVEEPEDVPKKDNISGDFSPSGGAPWYSSPWSDGRSSLANDPVTITIIITVAINGGDDLEKEVEAI